ncbi:LysR family transcriptional regulator [Bacillus sp. CCB-MMP212]|uniref:LysR family transcriptional regulator n=1 Tax=Bacillus TaxID=1386 RepID=UPI001F609D81|nr:LysR family transcriptional regulator [Bacillus sp. CCB-MMP212]MCI4253121.1 LysR family transcriptional regulator [Bacillus sp. CCB-MMP212]MDA2074407.1 LysR family transcriptional regulator [Bacillus cereus]MDA2302884.1 LysR family transcriptional regulator [Bacillus cereus]MDA2308333.1 LysR family transcriptional regulator [Bacillus cereus]
MDFRDLKIFQTVARVQNITAAARILNYVQSNVTARIKLLEQELDTVLFYRHARGITLTGDGQIFLKKVNKLLKEFEELQNTFIDDDNPTGLLNIGTVDTVHPLPTILASYHKQFPNVDISLKTDVSQRLIIDILEFKLDGAFVTSPIQDSSLEQYKVSTKTLVLFSNRPTFDIQDLKNETFLVFSPGCGYRFVLEKWLKDEGILLKKIMEFNMLEMILHSVSLGLGITVLPVTALTFFTNIPNIYSHEIPGKYGKIETIFVRNKDIALSLTMRKFIENIQSL